MKWFEEQRMEISCMAGSVDDTLRGGRGHAKLTGGIGDDLYWCAPGADLYSLDLRQVSSV